MLIVWVGGHAIAQSTLQIGDMMAFIQYAMQIIMAFLMLAMIFILVPRASVSAGRILEVLDAPLSIQDPEKPEVLEEPKGVVEFQDVSFRYHNADGDVLEHISFTAKPGETTAFIGATGAGKSTLVNLIPRFYDVTEGAVTIDGVDVRKLSQHQLREIIGYVPQKGMLFSGTVASNLRYGKEDATGQELQEALATAQAADFVNAMDEGVDSPISQGGTNVSGGQRQRLSIARALARKAPIYIFDDSFSALDFKTDAALRKALARDTAKRHRADCGPAGEHHPPRPADHRAGPGEDGGQGHPQGAAANLPRVPGNCRKPAAKGGIGMSQRGHAPRHGGPAMAGEKAKNFKGSSKRLLKYLRPFWVPVIFVMLFAAASTVFSIVGPKVLALATDELANGLVRIVTGAQGGIDFGYIGKVLLLLGGIYLLSAGFSYAQGFIMAGVTADLSYGLRDAIEKKINKLPLSYFHRVSQGDVLSRITNDVDTLTNSLNQSVTQLITSVCTLIGVLIMMLTISWQLTLVALCIVPVSLVFVMVIVKFSQKHFKAQQYYLGSVNGQVEEMYGGHLVVKAFGREKETVAAFERREPEALQRRAGNPSSSRG